MRLRLTFEGSELNICLLPISHIFNFNVCVKSYGIYKNYSCIKMIFTVYQKITISLATVLFLTLPQGNNLTCIRMPANFPVINNHPHHLFQLLYTGWFYKKALHKHFISFSNYPLIIGCCEKYKRNAFYFQ